MTDNEILKALELCNKPVSKANCTTCPFLENKIGCSHVMINEAIDLINRQKAENEDLFYKLQGVMLSVDKWLEGDELKQDEVNRAATMREKTLQIVEKLEAVLLKKEDTMQRLNKEQQYTVDELQRAKAEIERLSTEIDQRHEMMANLGVELDKAQSLNKALGNDVDIKLKYIYDLEERLNKYQHIESSISEFWTGLEKLSMYKGKEKPTLEELLEYIEQVKDEAYKELAERLKATDLSGTVGEKYVNGEMYGYFHNGAFERIVDNLLAELTPSNFTKVDHSSLCETETYEGVTDTNVGGKKNDFKEEKIMGDCMTFPATFEEFAEEYKVVDSKEVYTNGTELIPIFRVKQWLEHTQNDFKE